MLVNKKAILGMFVAIVMSLGIMSGINGNRKQDINLQQLGIVSAYVSGETEGGASSAWGAVSNWCIGTSAGMGTVGVGSIYLSGTNPVGWGYWCATGGLAL